MNEILFQMLTPDAVGAGCLVVYGVAFYNLFIKVNRNTPPGSELASTMVYRKYRRGGR